MFIFPDITYRNPGGAENLIFQVITQMLKSHGQESMVIGTQESYLVKRLTSENILFKFVDQNKMPKNISANDLDVIILFHNYDGLDKLKALKCKVLIWGILASQITGWNRFGFEKTISGKKVTGEFFTRKLLAEMSEKNALISMDGATCDEIDRFVGHPLRLPIISIPVDIEQLPLANMGSKSNSDSLRLSYIGRSDDIWKIKPVKKIIADLARLNNCDFTVSIYTKESEPFKRELDSVSAPNITVQFHLGIYGAELRNHLNRNSDLHFSMGTAALEGACAGLPVVLMDASIHDFPSNYRYRWLCETERCSLGRFIDQNESNFAGMQMKEVVEACLNEKSRKHIESMCFSYVVQNHSVTAIVNTLINHKSSARMRDIVRNTPATWTAVSALKWLIA